MSHTELIECAERVLDGAQSFTQRLQARANHRKQAGRKLSAADVAEARQMKTAVTDAITALDRLLNTGNPAGLVAMRHRLRQIDLIDL